MSEQTEKLDSLAAKLASLPGITFAIRNGDEVEVTIVGHVDYERIADIAGDAELRIAQFTEFSDEFLPRFKADRDVVDWFNRLGRPMEDGVAKLIAHYAKLKHPPKLNAIIGDKMGILFHDAEDRAKYEDYALPTRDMGIERD